MPFESAATPGLASVMAELRPMLLEINGSLLISELSMSVLSPGLLSIMSFESPFTV